MKLIYQPTGKEIIPHVFDQQKQQWVALWTNNTPKRRVASPPNTGKVLNIATWCAGSNIAFKMPGGYEGVMSCTRHQVVVDTNNFKLRFVITLSNVGRGQSGTLRVAIGYPGDQPVDLTFSGSKTYKFLPASDNAQIFETDTVNMDLITGEDFYVYSWIDADGPDGDLPSDLTQIRPSDPGIGYGPYIQAMSSIQNITVGETRWSFRPAGILSISDQPSWIASGDSIVQQRNSYVERVPNELGWATCKACQGADGYFNHTVLDGYDNRYDPYLKYATHILDEFSINDTPGAADWLEIANRSLLVWQKIKNRNPDIKIVKTTTTLYTQSIDNWTTIEGQTVDVTAKRAGNRAGYNDWLRDGAPIVNGSPVSPGTPGASRADFVTSGGVLRRGTGDHIVTAISNVAEAIESGVNTHKYSVDVLKKAGVYGGTQDGLHPAPGIHDILADRLKRDLLVMNL